MILTVQEVDAALKDALYSAVGERRLAAIATVRQSHEALRAEVDQLRLALARLNGESRKDGATVERDRG